VRRVTKWTAISALAATGGFSVAAAHAFAGSHRSTTESERPGTEGRAETGQTVPITVPPLNAPANAPAPTVPSAGQQQPSNGFAQPATPLPFRTRRAPVTSSRGS